MAVSNPTEYRRKLVKRRRNALVFRAVCMSAILLSLLMLAALLYSVLAEALQWFNLDGSSIVTLLTDIPSSKAVASGLWPAIVGTLWVMGICIVVSFTVGVAAAIYLEEYAGGRRIDELIQVNIQNLAAVPSIVYGILGLTIFVAVFALGKSVLTAGLTLALLIMPVVIVSAEEAIRAVPLYRQGRRLCAGGNPLAGSVATGAPTGHAGYPYWNYPGGQPGDGGSCSAGDYGRPFFRALCANLSTGSVYRFANPDLRVDLQTAGRVPPTGRRRHRGTVDHAVGIECCGHSPAQPSPGQTPGVIGYDKPGNCHQPRNPV